MQYYRKLTVVIVVMALLAVSPAWAQVERYVSLTGTNDIAGGYTNWTGAATSLLAAVTVANSNKAGDIVWVESGIYSVPIVVIVSNTVVRGFSGNPADVVVNAGGVTQCFVLRHTNAMIEALTLSNGAYASIYRGGALTIETGAAVNAVIGWSFAPRGGGVMLRGATKDSAILERCVIIGNSSSLRGAGVSFFQGSGTMRDSTIVSNYSETTGAGIGYDSATNCHVLGCMVRENTSAGNGGGIYYNSSVTGLISGCTIEKNVCLGSGYGAGIYSVSPGEIRNSIIINNSSSNYAGGVAFVNSSIATGPMRSCLIASNSATTNAGGYYCRYSVTLENCTITANTAARGGGMYLFNDAAYDRTFRNCIVYDNLRTVSGEHDVDDGNGANVTNKFYYCVSRRSLPAHQGNMTNAPLWMDFVNGNYRLQETSPCINAGTNETWMEEALDLDGFGRKDRFSGKVDIGAYEYVPEGMLFISK